MTAVADPGLLFVVGAALVLVWGALFLVGVACSLTLATWGTGQYAAQCAGVILVAAAFIGLGMGSASPLPHRIGTGLAVALCGGLALFVPVYVSSRTGRRAPWLAAGAGAALAVCLGAALALTVLGRA